MTDKLIWIQSKICRCEEIVRKANAWRGSGKKIVFTNGCFDLIHTGHIDYLARAASLGNVLIVGLNSDRSVKRLKGESRPVNTEGDRALALAALLLVDAVVVFEEDTPAQLIAALMPDVLAKGGDYTSETIVGADIVKGGGGEVVVIPFVEGYSTTGLLGRIRQL